MSDEWMAAAEAMAGLLERENAALAALDLRGAAALLEGKRQALAALAAAPPEGAGVAMARRLAGLAEENKALLERGLAAQQRVVALMVEAARAVRGERAPEGGRYTAAGARARPGGAAIAFSARA